MSDEATPCTTAEHPGRRIVTAPGVFRPISDSWMLAAHVADHAHRRIALRELGDQIAQALPGAVSARLSRNGAKCSASVRG